MTPNLLKNPGFKLRVNIPTRLYPIRLQLLIEQIPTKPIKVHLPLQRVFLQIIPGFRQ